MPGPGYQKKSSKKRTTAPNAAVTSPANGNASTTSESTLACHDFCHFLEMADRKTIAQFCNWAATTSDGENLRLLWICALDKGEKLGIIEGKRLGLKEGIERGIDLGRKEGYQVAKEGFDKIIQAVKAKATPKKPNTYRMATQTNDAVMQMAPNDELLHLLNDAGTSTELPSTCNMASQTCRDPSSHCPCYQPCQCCHITANSACTAAINHHHRHIPCFKPAPNTSKTTAHSAESTHRPPAKSPAAPLEP
ncbi:hypothetical protein L208DRAFT_743322 [Tricholoma matsutake]|nr:hypothetical protein L208DRAFT_743322 [Tricholoma matsutake 945]